MELSWRGPQGTMQWDHIFPESPKGAQIPSCSFFCNATILKFKIYSIFRIQFYHQPQTLYWSVIYKPQNDKKHHNSIIEVVHSWEIFWFFLSHMIALSVWCFVTRHTRTNDVRHQSCHFYGPYHFVYSRVLWTVRFSVNNDIKSVLQSSAPLWPLEAWRITHHFRSHLFPLLQWTHSPLHPTSLAFFLLHLLLYFTPLSLSFPLSSYPSFPSSLPSSISVVQSSLIRLRNI